MYDLEIRSDSIMSHATVKSGLNQFPNLLLSILLESSLILILKKRFHKTGVIWDNLQNKGMSDLPDI